VGVIDYKPYRGIPISRDTNVYGEQVYIGNGQGCHTFWFASVKEARKFIDYYSEMIDPSDPKLGLIPNTLCKRCQHHYSPIAKEYRMYPPFACRELKEKLISALSPAPLGDRDGDS
jgi:hypothetical protein